MSRTSIADLHWKTRPFSILMERQELKQSTNGACFIIYFLNISQCFRMWWRTCMEYFATISIAFWERKKRIHDNVDRFVEEYNCCISINFVSTYEHGRDNEHVRCILKLIKIFRPKFYNLNSPTQFLSTGAQSSNTRIFVYFHGLYKQLVSSQVSISRNSYKLTLLHYFSKRF